jgi:hypothetical protein
MRTIIVPASLIISRSTVKRLAAMDGGTVTSISESHFK